MTFLLKNLYKQKPRSFCAIGIDGMQTIKADTWLIMIGDAEPSSFNHAAHCCLACAFDSSRKLVPGLWKTSEVPSYASGQL